MPTPEPYPYRKLNYPVNNLQQDFTEAQKAQTRANIGIPASVGETGKVLGVSDASTGELGWVAQPSVPSVDQSYDATSANPQSGTAVAEAISTKQDNIPDLSDIRSGAALGETAVQPADLAPYATTSDMNTALATKQDTISDLSAIRSGAQLGASSVQDVTVDGVSVVSGGVAAITTPTFTQQQANWTESDTSSVSYIQNKPSIPTKTSDLTNDSGFITLSDVPAQVNADWESNSGASEILHKPDLSIYAETANLATVATTGDYDDLVNKPTIPAAQVNSDWNSNSGVSQILNKPQLSTVATTGDYNDLINQPSIPAAQVNADWNSTSGVSEILNKPSLAAVATSGDYSDLSNTPSIPTATSDLTNDSGFITIADVPAQVQSDWNESDSSDPAYIQNKPTIPAAQVNADWNSSSGVSEILNKPNLATVATTGDYSDLSNTPSIPTATSDLTNDSGFITLSDVPAQVQSDWTESDTTDPAYIANKPNLAAVATSGSYIDLSNKPAIPTVDQTYNASSTNAQSGAAVAQAIAAIPSSSYTAGDAIDITNNEISVVYDSDTLELQQTPAVTHTYDVNVVNTDSFGGPYSTTPYDIVRKLRTVPVTVHIPANTFYSWYTGGNDAVVVFKTNQTDMNRDSTYSTATLSYTQDQSTSKYWLDEQDVVINTLVGDSTCNYFTFGLMNSGMMSNDTWRTDTQMISSPVVFSYSEAAGAAELAVKNPLPSSSSADEGKVLKVDANGDPEWATGGGGSQVQSNWLEDDTTDPSYIENKPTPKTLVAGQGIAISESSASLTVTNTVARDAVNLIAGQGVTLTQSGSDLTISSAGTTYTAGTGIDITNDEISLEAPVDLVAGPGIVVDNPDGNTLRVSMASNEEAVLWSDAAGDFAVTLNESLFNFEKIKVFQLTETTYHIQEFYTSDLTSNVFTIGATYQALSNQIYSFSSKWYITNSGVNLESTGKGYGLVGSTNGFTFYSSNVYNGKICRVIGVHRINGGN